MSISDFAVLGDDLSPPYCIPVMSKEYKTNTVYFYAVDKTELASFPDQAIRPCLIYSKCFEIES